MRDDVAAQGRTAEVHLHSYSPTTKGRGVDLDLSADQELLRETTHKFLTATWPTSALREVMDGPLGFDRHIWEQGAELGWTSMLVPEKFDGGSVSGEGVCDLGIIAEELGRFLLAGPVLPTNIVAYALARSGSDEMSGLHLPAIAAGREIATWAVAEEPDGWAAECRRGPGLEQREGLPAHRSQDPGPGCPRRRLPPGDGEDFGWHDPVPGSGRRSRVSRWSASNASTSHADSDESVSRTSRCHAMPSWAASMAPRRTSKRRWRWRLALQCAETIGSTDRMYEVLLEYVRDRKSFGRPIGSYQAIKHRLVDMLLWLESGKAATVASIKAVQSEIDATTWPAWPSRTSRTAAR